MGHRRLQRRLEGCDLVAQCRDRRLDRAIPRRLAEGTDTLTNVEALRFSDRRVEFAKAFTDDVSGDGVSDILWRNADGSLAYWAMHGLTGTDVSLPTVSTDWTLLGAGDLNGDGWADLLWRHSDGALATWYSGGTGFIGGGGPSPMSTPPGRSPRSAT